MTNLFSKEELLQFNEKMLGRGMPVQQDGIGYNKGDYGACKTYYYGLSDAQYADLAKRLVKYSKTQLDIDKEDMKNTALHLKELAGSKDRSKGISIDITENGTFVGFRFNELFISALKKATPAQWDGTHWVIPTSNVLKALRGLGEVGADVKNAIEYAKNYRGDK